MEHALNLLEKGEISVEHTIKLLSNPSHPVSHRETATVKTTQHALARFDTLVGLKKPKNIIKEYLAYIQIQQVRKEQGLKADNVTMHMAFAGNPGTGKTSFARVMGEVCNDLKLLSKGHLVEVDRGELVGEYIGHTAQKTKRVIQKALGGILFIDEAYSLNRGDEKDFGTEAIDTLVKEIEDQRENLIMIVAGYLDEMENFLQSNPGLASRIPLKIHFPDYSIGELLNIAELLLKDKDYILTIDGRKKLHMSILTNLAKGDNGNGRMVRNLLEKVFRSQAARLVNKINPSRLELMQLQAVDFSEEEEEPCHV